MHSIDKSMTTFSLIMIFIVFVIHCVQSLDSSSDKSLDPKWHYFTHNESVEYMKQLEQKYNNLVKVASIGKSVENRDLMTIKISKDVNERQVLKPMFKYVANIHGNEALGQHLLLVLAHTLCENYGSDERITRI